MSSRREILVTITNLKKKRLLQPDSFWLFLALSGFLAFLEQRKKLTEVSDPSEIVRTDIY